MSHGRRSFDAFAMAGRMAELADDATAALLEHRIIGHFELARFHDARNQTAAAFPHWHRGHSLLAEIQPFSRAAYGAFIDASIACFDRERLHSAPRSLA